MNLQEPIYQERQFYPATGLSERSQGGGALIEPVSVVHDETYGRQQNWRQGRSRRTSDHTVWYFHVIIFYLVFLIMVLINDTRKM